MPRNIFSLPRFSCADWLLIAASKASGFGRLISMRLQFCPAEETIVQTQCSNQQQRQSKDSDAKCGESGCRIGPGRHWIAIGEMDGLAARDTKSLVEVRVGSVDPAHQGNISERPCDLLKDHNQKDNPSNLEKWVGENFRGKVLVFRQAGIS